MKTLALLLLLAPQDEPSIYEPVVLPYAMTGVEDHASSRESPRHVLNVRLDGSVVYRGRVVHDPESGSWEAVDALLAQIAAEIPSAPLFEGGPAAPTGALLIRGEGAAYFRTVQKLMERGAKRLFRHFHFAVGDAERPRMTGHELTPIAGPAQYLPLELRTHAWIAATEGKEPEPMELVVRVRAPGRKVEPRLNEAEPWSGKPGTRWRWDSTQRSTEYLFGPHRTADVSDLEERLAGTKAERGEGFPLVIDARPGVTIGEALMMLDLARRLEIEDVRFVGAFDEDR